MPIANKYPRIEEMFWVILYEGIFVYYEIESNEKQQKATTKSNRFFEMTLI